MKEGCSCEIKPSYYDQHTDRYSLEDLELNNERMNGKTILKKQQQIFLAKEFLTQTSLSEDIFLSPQFYWIKTPSLLQLYLKLKMVIKALKRHPFPPNNRLLQTTNGRSYETTTDYLTFPDDLRHVNLPHLHFPIKQFSYCDVSLSRIRYHRRS